MHIEPGVVDGAKMVLAYGTAAAAGGYSLKLAADDLKTHSAISFGVRSVLAVAAVFLFFEVFPHFATAALSLRSLQLALSPLKLLQKRSFLPFLPITALSSSPYMGNRSQWRHNSAAALAWGAPAPIFKASFDLGLSASRVWAKRTGLFTLRDAETRE